MSSADPTITTPEAPTPPQNLTEALTAVMDAWHVAWGFPLGPIALHRLFGQKIPGSDFAGGYGIASRMDGTARDVGDAERALIPETLAFAVARAADDAKWGR